MRPFLCLLFTPTFALAQAPAEGSVADPSADTLAPVPAPSESATESVTRPIDEPITEVFAFGDTPPADPGRSLWAGDREAALRAIEADTNPPSPAVACLEAALRDQRLRESYLPGRPPVDRLTAQLFATARASLEGELEATYHAYSRCVAGATRVPSAPVVAATESGVAHVNVEALRNATVARHSELERARPAVLEGDDATAYEALRGILIDTDEEPSTPERAAREEPEPWSLEAAAAWHVAGHGRLPIPPEPKREPTWRITPLITGVLEFCLALALIPASLRGDSDILDSGRVRMALLGMGFGGILSMVLFPTWAERGRDKRLALSGPFVLGALALGLGTALADVRPRLRAFGAALTASAAVDLGFWIGGAVIQRRWRPVVSASRHHGSLGWHVSF
ncbi:MAG: hypothetical protein KC586_10050 [Myxococcales bacterium]|nr:hypothetical protein [Myxococcales bacterium]